MNLHPSLLPKYRGCSSLTWSMIKGDKVAGFSYHYMEEECDTGNIILQEELPIYSYDNQLSLYQRAMVRSLDKFNQAFQLLINGYDGTPQSGEASYFARGATNNGEINKDWGHKKIKNFIRAMINPPLPYAVYKEKEIKSYEDFIKIINEDSD